MWLGQQGCTSSQLGPSIMLFATLHAPGATQGGQHALECAPHYTCTRCWFSDSGVDAEMCSKRCRAGVVVLPRCAGEALGRKPSEGRRITLALPRRSAGEGAAARGPLASSLEESSVSPTTASVACTSHERHGSLAPTHSPRRKRTYLWATAAIFTHLRGQVDQSDGQVTLDHLGQVGKRHERRVLHQMAHVRWHHARQHILCIFRLRQLPLRTRSAG